MSQIIKILVSNTALLSRRTIFTIIIVFSFITISSCSTFNGTRLEGLLGGEENLIKLAYNIADDLEKTAFPPLMPHHPEQPILTTTFANNNNLNETSRFSRLLQEHLASRLVQLGYSVREIKLSNELDITPGKGETILSRNLNQIKADQPAQAVSVGTYSLSNRNLYITARMVDPVNSNIISSVDYKVVMDKNILAMFGLQLKPADDTQYVEEPRTSFMTRLLY